jgi:rod shape-determining protein MreB
MFRNLADSFWKFFTDDIGIDLGTANTKIALREEGIVATEPTVVAINKKTKKILSVGTEAKKMIGRTPSNIVAIRPLKDGVISDFDATRDMIQHFIELAYSRSTKLIKIPRPRVVIGIPSTATEVGKKAVKDAARSAGARQAYVIEEPMAAAIGAGLPITEPQGSMIVDIGGGTTDIAIISLGGIVVDKTIQIAGDEMDAEIVNYVKHKYNIIIGERIAEDIKIKIGSAYQVGDSKTAEVRGRDLIDGVPKVLTLTSLEIREAISLQLKSIAEAISLALEEAPPELLSDIGEKGIVFAGGGSMIPGIAKYFEEKVKVKCVVANDPITCVVKGTQLLLEDIDLLSRVQVDKDND